MGLATKILLALGGVSAIAIGLQGSPVEMDAATPGFGDVAATPGVGDIDDVNSEEDILALFDNIDDQDDDAEVEKTEEEMEDDVDDGEDVGPRVRGGGRGRGGVRGRRIGGGRRGQGRGQAQRWVRRQWGHRRTGHPACPLMDEAISDVKAFAADCLEEIGRVKFMIKKSRRNKKKPCNHECCEVGEGKKCCPSIEEGNCTLVIKDAVSLDIKLVRRRGGRGRGRGRGRAGQGAQREDEESPTQCSCTAPQPFLRQLVSCGERKSRVLFVKGIPTALNPNLLCRSDVDCAEDEICCSSANDKCHRSCAKKSS